MAATDGDEYEVPLRDQRFFGAGIKRRRIQFVPSTTRTLDVRSLPTTPSHSAADAYLSIVLKKSTPSERGVSAPPAEYARPGEDTEELVVLGDDSTGDGESSDTTCEICHRSINPSEPSAPHETSIAHQICLQHSHPPSHIDRRRKGLAVLEGQGWDPDSRRGLGAEGERHAASC